VKDLEFARQELNRIQSRLLESPMCTTSQTQTSIQGEVAMKEGEIGRVVRRVFN